MKKFIINIVVVCFIASVILSSITIWDATKLQRISYKLPVDVHIIVMGPSTTGCAVNESLIPGVKNLSRDGSAYLSYKLIPNILNENNQIDTVFINWGRYWAVNSGRINVNEKDIAYQKSIFPFILLNKDEINWGSNIITWLKLFTSPDLMKILFRSNTLDGWGFGYIKLERNFLHSSDKLWGIQWYNDKKIKKSIESLKDNAQTTKEIVTNSIIECKKRNVVPIIFFTPLYQFERWCNKKIIADILLEENPEILIADYEDFEFPDDSYYADVHHLNYRGANYFSNYIAEHGIEYVTLQKWIENINEKTNE